MKNWGNWSFKEIQDVINKARAEGRSQVAIDQEHTDYMNDRDVCEWLDAMGLAYDKQMERTVIYLNGKGKDA